MTTPNPGPPVVAGFEPFLGRRRNRSWEVVRRLAGESETERVRLPVDFDRLPDAIEGLLTHAPRALLLVGEAPGRRVRVEQLAVNVVDTDLPDNGGRAPKGEALRPGAPLALSAPWDARELAARLEEARIPARASFHAGTYACNAALFLALERAPAGTAVGLLHVPRARWPRAPRRRALDRAVRMALATLLRPAGGRPPS